MLTSVHATEDFFTACTLTRNGHLRTVSAEIMNVALNPLETKVLLEVLMNQNIGNKDLVEHAEVGGNGVCVDKAQCSKPVDGYLS